MAPRFLKSWASRSTVPAEKMCAFILIAVNAIRAANGQTEPVPFHVCGHVYLLPSVGVYQFIALVAFIALCSTLFDMSVRVFSVLNGHTTYKAACVMNGRFFGRIAVFWMDPFTTIWDILTLSMCIFGFFKFLNGREMTPALYAFVPFITVQILKILVSINMPSIILKILAVIITDRVYFDPELENHSWISTTVPKTGNELERNNTERGSIHLPNYREGVLLSIPDGRTLFVPVSGDYGIIGRLPFGLHPSCGGEIVPITRGEKSFSVLPVQIPYSLAWFSIYELIRVMDGYKGAYEIDKCLAWLLVVSALAGFLVNIIPGPCVVVCKKNKQPNPKDTASFEFKHEENEVSYSISF